MAKGTVWRRTDADTYVARIIIEGRRFVKGGFPNRSMAQDWIDTTHLQAKQAQALGITFVYEDLAFADFLPRWRQARAPRVSAKTLDGYMKVAEGVLKPFFGRMPLAKIRAREVEEFLARRAAAGVKGATLNRYLTVLSSILGLAKDLQHARENAARGVKRGREVLPPPRYLPREDEDRLLVAAGSGWLRAAILLALDGGLRAGEVGALTRRDVDFSRRTVTVRESKNKESREVGLTTRLFETLRGHVKSLPAGQDLLFVIPGRPPFDRGGYRHAFEGAVKAAKVGPLRFHDLRHAAGVRLAEAGATLGEIKAFLGHKSAAATLRYIRHAPRDAARRAAALLDRARAEKDSCRDAAP